MNASKVYKRSIIDLFRLGSCVLCRHSASVQSGLCHSCRATLLPAPAPACRCGLPCPSAAPGGETAQAAPLCGSCLARPPAFSRICCAHSYAFPLDQLFNRYKHRRQLSAERALEQLWQAALPFPGPLPDALVPMPSHWRRRWWRGFDPAARLAQQAGEQLALPVLDALRRTRATPRQQGLTAARRARNLRGALVACQPVAGLSLALVDDVVTTGSSAREASALLLASGATDVQVWALARTLPGRNR